MWITPNKKAFHGRLRFLDNRRRCTRYLLWLCNVRIPDYFSRGKLLICWKQPLCLHTLYNHPSRSSNIGWCQSQEAQNNIAKGNAMNQEEPDFHFDGWAPIILRKKTQFIDETSKRMRGNNLQDATESQRKGITPQKENKFRSHTLNPKTSMNVVCGHWMEFEWVSCKGLHRPGALHGVS